MTTSGNPAGTGGSNLWGLDWQYRNPQFLPDRNLAVDVWTQTSDNPATSVDGGGSGSAHGFAFNWDNIGPIGNIAVQRVDQAFAPALGFVTETGIEQVFGESGYWWRTDGGGDVIPQLDWEWKSGLHDDRFYNLLNPEIYVGNAVGLPIAPPAPTDQNPNPGNPWEAATDNVRMFGAMYNVESCSRVPTDRRSVARTAPPTTIPSVPNCAVSRTVS